MLDEQLAVACAKFNEAEKLLISSLISDWYGDYLEFYRGQFIVCDLLKCLETTNRTELQDTITKSRVRVPKSVASKRELHYLAMALKKKIRILDYDCNERESHGSGECLNIYVNEAGESVIPKALTV